MVCGRHCSQLSTIMFNIVTPDPGSTVLFHIVDNYEQCGQQNNVQSWYTTGSEFLAVYAQNKKGNEKFK